MTERNYHNATHILTPVEGDEPLRCHVLGKRGESLHLVLFGGPGVRPREVFVDPRRVTELASLCRLCDGSLLFYGDADLGPCPNCTDTSDLV